jgi:hypothetical protein
MTWPMERGKPSQGGPIQSDPLGLSVGQPLGVSGFGVIPFTLPIFPFVGAYLRGQLDSRFGCCKCADGSDGRYSVNTGSFELGFYVGLIPPLG